MNEPLVLSNLGCAVPLLFLLEIYKFTLSVNRECPYTVWHPINAHNIKTVKWRMHCALTRKMEIPSCQISKRNNRGTAQPRILRKHTLELTHEEYKCLRKQTWQGITEKSMKISACGQWMGTSTQYCAMDTGAQVYCNVLYTCESGTRSGWDSSSLTVSWGLGNGGHLKQSIKVADPFIIRRTDFIYIKPTAARTTF